MNRLINKCYALLLSMLAVSMLGSCDMMTDDMEDCPYGLYVTFKYDYNLQRADMFNDHVGSVTLYVFDESGKLVKTYEESNADGMAPLASPAYAMHITDLPPGRYRLLALAGQRPYAEQLESGRAKFVRAEMTAGSDITSLDVSLDKQQRADGLYDIVNNGLPLDTLWHGLTAEPVQVYCPYTYHPTYATVSLVRDTKKINVTLRELDDPTQMDIDDYDLRIYDRNSHILWDNSLDETDAVVYTPHAVWNTDDRTPAVDAEGNPLGEVGCIGHADFMTSRLIYHDDAADDGRLVITSKLSGEEVVRLNLPDILSRLRTSEDRYRYTEQEFLDRGYDYQLDIFLRGGRLSYVNISISVLSWSKRIQFEEL